MKTLGPLTICAYPNVRRIDIETNGRVLASLPFGRDDVDAEANAALFAASPEMLAVITALIIERDEHVDHVQVAIDRARAVLEKLRAAKVLP